MYMRFFFLSFWCGSLCAAHPPPPEGRASRVRPWGKSPSIFMHLSSCIQMQTADSCFHCIPPSYVPSPGPAHTAALRPQFAFEASKCYFFAFQNSSHFLLPFFIEKTAKIIDFGLPKPSQNPPKMPSKSHSKITCNFSSMFEQFFSFVWCSISWKSWFSYRKITIF